MVPRNRNKGSIMKLEVTKELLGYDGKPLTEPDGKSVTLRDVCCKALSQYEEKDQNSFKKGCLARAIYSEDEPEIEAADISLIKECVAKFYSPAIVFPAHNLLEGRDCLHIPNSSSK